MNPTNNRLAWRDQATAERVADGVHADLRTLIVELGDLATQIDSLKLTQLAERWVKKVSPMNYMASKVEGN